MKITEFHIKKSEISKKNYIDNTCKYYKAVVSNKTSPTDDEIISLLARVLFDMYNNK